jgi:hypothetical protein
MSALVFGLLRTRALLRIRDGHRECGDAFSRGSLAHFHRAILRCVCANFFAPAQNAGTRSWRDDLGKIYINGWLFYSRTKNNLHWPPPISTTLPNAANAPLARLRGTSGPSVATRQICIFWVI